jgi:hypothetical protein
MQIQKVRGKRFFNPFVKGVLLAGAFGLVFIAGMQIGSGNWSLSFSRQAINANKDLPNRLDYSSVDKVYDDLRRKFDGELDEQKLIDGLKKGLVEAAVKENCDAIAHGATGKGNDQVRFELTAMALAPHLKIIAPWREWKIRSRNDAIEFAQKHGIPIPVTKKHPYSMDGNLWHLSHEGGELEDPWNEPNEHVYTITDDPLKVSRTTTSITIGFEKGKPVSLNGKKTKFNRINYKIE